MGIMAFGAILYWRQQTLTNAEYAEPLVQRKGIGKSDALRSKNYELEVIETSPAVK